MPLDADLQALYDASTVIEHRANIMMIQAVRDRAAAIKLQTLMVQQSSKSLLEAAGISKDDLIERIYLNLAEAFMRPNPATATTGQSPSAMTTEATANGMRLGKAAWQVWKEIDGAKKAW